MKISISKHAWARMKVYGFNKEVIFDAVKHPDEVVEGYAGRLVAHKSLDHFILRVVYEKYGDKVVVVTVYPAERERYRGR